MVYSRLFLVFLVLSVFACENADFTQKGKKPLDEGKSGKLECDGVLIDTVVVSDYNIEETDKGEIWTKTRIRASMTPYTGDISPEANYGYKDLKANIVYGEQPKDQTATHFTYRYKGKTYLYFVFQNKEEATELAEVKVKVSVQGNGMQDAVIVSDEAFEMGRDFDVELSETYHLATFKFQQFTDGAVIGPLKGQDWKAKVEYKTMTEDAFEQMEFSDRLITTSKFQPTQLQTFLLTPAKVQGCELPN